MVGEYSSGSIEVDIDVAIVCLEVRYSKLGR